MATQISTALRYKRRPAAAEPMHFRRNDGKVKTRKVRRKIKLKFKHILACFFLILGIFFSIQRSYLFLISWKKFDVRHLEIQCRKLSVKEDITQFFRGKSLGNLMLLDMGMIKKALLSHPWIKDVHVRRSFPSTVKIDIKERQPAALMKSEALYLIDREGVKLQKVDPAHPGAYPILTDTRHFQKHVSAKLNLAWDCLDSLEAVRKMAVEVIDLTEYGNAKVKLKNSPTWIIFGSGDFKRKIEFLHAHQNTVQSYGALEYVDLRFKDRLYLRPLESWARNNAFSTDKEAN